MNRFRRQLLRLKLFRNLHRHSYDRQAALEFLFEHRSHLHNSVDRGQAASKRSNGQATMLIAGNQAPHCATRREDFVLRGSEVPRLTVTSDPCSSIAVFGSTGPDWKLAFNARGEGASEAEAQERVQAISLGIAGGSIALTAPNLLEGHQWRGELLIEGPANAGVVIHGSYASAEVMNMAGSVRVAATHARARVLDTNGQVDVTAGVIDFAGSHGRVTLSAEMEINLKIRSMQFEGILLAWAQRSVRVLVPPGFTTPIKAIVSGQRDFVCRTEFASQVMHQRQGELHIFSYGQENGAPPRSILHLRSENAAVVIDTSGQ